MCSSDLADNCSLKLSCGDAKNIILPIGDVAEIPSRVTVGFRPEDVIIQNGGESKAFSGNAFVRAVEAMGGETLIHLEDAGVQFSARALGFLSLFSGARIPYMIPAEKLHLFEKNTGRRIENRITSPA